MKSDEFRIMSIPVHPDEMNIPHSVVHLPMPSGRIISISGPLAPKSMSMLRDTLLICKDALVAKPEDFSI